MVYLAFIVLLVAAALCLGLSRVVATQRLGFFATGATIAAAVLLLLEWFRGPMFDMPTLTWAAWDQIVVVLSPQLDTLSRGFALVLLYSGALALLALSLTIAPTVRGFGSLFASGMLVLAVVLTGLISSMLLLPLTWSLVVLLGYSTVWSSGALRRSEKIPLGLTLGILASILLLGGVLVAEPALSAGQLPSMLAAMCILGACLILVGGAPFHSALDEAVAAPAALGALLHGVVFPLVALPTLVRLLIDMQAVLPPSWRVALVLLGGISWLACSAGALREHGLRGLLGWQASGQASLVVVAVGLAGPLAMAAVPALIVNLAFTTLAGALAITALERLTGSDDFTRITPKANLRLPGLVWGLVSLSALGLPPMWGFWGRYWLLESALATMLWVVPLILAGSVLATLAYLGPLVRFVRRDFGVREVVTDVGRVQRLTAAGFRNSVVLGLVLVPLIGFGLMPHLVWDYWLQAVLPTPGPLPVSNTVWLISVGVGVLMGLVILLLVVRRDSARRTLADEDMVPVILAPDALAERVSLFAWFGNPHGVIRWIWQGIQFLGRGAELLVMPFEQRFYLASVFLAVIIVLLVMALSGGGPSAPPSF